MEIFRAGKQNARNILKSIGIKFRLQFEFLLAKSFEICIIKNIASKG